MKKWLPPVPSSNLLPNLFLSFQVEAIQKQATNQATEQLGASTAIEHPLPRAQAASCDGGCVVPEVYAARYREQAKS